MVGKFDECIGVAAAGFPDDFESFDRTDLAEESQNEVLGDADVQVADVERPGSTDT